MKNLSVIKSSNYRIAQHAQLVWKRFFEKSLYSRRPFPQISKLAQAVTLALSRSDVVVPGIFTLTCGNVAWAQKSTNLDTVHSNLARNTLYARAEDGHVFLTSLLHLALEGVVLLVRAFYLAILFSPSIILAPFADCLGHQFRKTWLQVVHHTLERAGPAFIKWGQWAATRPDLFPSDVY